MKYENTISELFFQFPILKDVYENEGDYIKDLPHLCYEIVFAPFIRQSVLKNDKCMTRAICNYMECMASSNDNQVTELLAVSVLESLVSERAVISLLSPYIGEKTSNILNIMEKEYGWDIMS